MRFSMLYSGEQILSFKSCLVFYAGDSLSFLTHSLVNSFLISVMASKNYFSFHAFSALALEF